MFGEDRCGKTLPGLVGVLRPSSNAEGKHTVDEGRREQFVNVLRLKKARALLVLSVFYYIYTEGCEGAARSCYVLTVKRRKKKTTLLNNLIMTKCMVKYEIINAFFALSFSERIQS